MKKDKIKVNKFTRFFKSGVKYLTIGVGTGVTFTGGAMAYELEFKDYVPIKDLKLTVKDLDDLQADKYILRAKNLAGYNSWFAKKDGITVSVSDKLDNKYKDATIETVDYLNKFFECVNDEYKFRIVAEGGDIKVLPLEEEWLINNRKNLKESAFAGTRTSKPFSLLVLNKNVSHKVFMNTDMIERTGVKNITRVILHEFAHALGLSDIEFVEYSGRSIMSCFAVDRYPAKFHARDIRALGGLYKKESVTKEDIYNIMKNEELCADPDRSFEDSARVMVNNNLGR